MHVFCEPVHPDPRTRTSREVRDNRWPKHRGPHLTLRLKALLERHRIAQAAWANAITQANGEPMSKTAGSFILLWGEWPRTTPRELIEDQTRAFLRARGVGANEIATAFDVDHDATETTERQQAPAVHARRKAKTTDAPPPPALAIEPLEPAMLSPLAKKHFQLFRDPFSEDITAAADVFTSPDIRYVRESMWTTARLGGFLAVVGESGAGKSVLRRDLIDRIQREAAPVRVIMPRVIDKSMLTAANICEAILQDLRPGIKVCHSLEARARQVETMLVQSSRGGMSHVLLIEEAHDLSIGALKYLKRFWELEDGFRKLLSIILIGQPELKMRLDERINFEAREVIRRCEIAELLPLDQHLGAYLEHKFLRQNASFAAVFDESAIDAMRQRLTQTRQGQTLSMLYPLIINNLAALAMNSAARDGVPIVSADVIAAL